MKTKDLKPYQLRLIIELKELNERIDRLSAFVFSKDYNNLTIQEQLAIDHQLSCMIDYRISLCTENITKVSYLQMKNLTASLMTFRLPQNLPRLFLMTLPSDTIVVAPSMSMTKLLTKRDIAMLSITQCVNSMIFTTFSNRIRLINSK